jgi:succinate-semialdehyde dehydrogenase/glutarate-semialdehyde dehydrogenase
MRNIGEACTAANRFIVHESLIDEFVARLAARMGALAVGDGTLDGVQVGPLINAAALDGVEALVAEAVSLGARVCVGGTRLDRPGFFMAPTVLADVPRDARVVREEIFGPVAPVLAFATIDEAVELANDTVFGLIGYVFAENLTEALTVAERLEVGMVGLNSGVVSNPAAPFGGVKASGLGREGSHEGIDEYLETKYIGLAL